MSPKKPDPATLLQLSSLISETTKSLASVLSASTGSSSETTLPSTELYTLQQTLISATAMLSGLVADPSVRVIEIAAQFLEARALHVVVEKRIPDILAKAGDGGMKVGELGKAAGIDAWKLGTCSYPLLGSFYGQC